jgi:hypothetical protein
MFDQAGKKRLVRLSLAVLAASLVGIAGCVKDVVERDSLTYSNVIEEVSNQLLLSNILRARDRAPLHFGDIPVIHESVQESASLGSSLLFGPLPATGRNARDSLSPALSLQVNPSFDMSHVDAKDFVTGIASPIDAKFVKYWLDRGVPQQLILELFFSSMKVEFPYLQQSSTTLKKKVKSTPVDIDPSISITLANSPRATSLDEQLGGAACDSRGVCDPSQFLTYLTVINNIYDFSAKPYTERALVWSGDKPEIKDKVLQGIAALDPTKYQMTYIPDPMKAEATANTVKVYTASADQKIVFCYAFGQPDDKEPAARHPVQTEISPSTSGAASTTSADNPCLYSRVDRLADAKPPKPAPQHNDLRFSRLRALTNFNLLLQQIDRTVLFEHSDGVTPDISKLIAKMTEAESRYRGIVNKDWARGALLDVPYVVSPPCDYDYEYNRLYLGQFDKKVNSGSVLDRLENVTHCDFTALVKGDYAHLTDHEFNEKLRETAGYIAVWALLDQVNPSLAASDLDVVNKAAKDGMLLSANPCRHIDSIERVWLCGRMERADWQAAVRYFVSMQLNVRCTKEVGKEVACASDSEGVKPNLLKETLSMRSVGEIIQYLGDLLWYQDNFGESELRNSPVTLGYCADRNTHPSHNCNDGALFRLYNTPLAGAPVRLTYHDVPYYIAPYSPADHTLQVLAILNQLIDLNKSATDLRATPTVQVIP